MTVQNTLRRHGHVCHRRRDRVHAAGTDAAPASVHDAPEAFLHRVPRRLGGQETYETARFLYADLQDDGTTVLDFNEAYNPPCSFNPYTTCPIPLKENILAGQGAGGREGLPDSRVASRTCEVKPATWCCRGVGGLRARQRACGRAPTGATELIPATPLTYGFFTAQFSRLTARSR